MKLCVWNVKEKGRGGNHVIVLYFKKNKVICVGVQMTRGGIMVVNLNGQ